jgi:hypothetical protein
MVTMTHTEWLAEAKRRFGDDPMAWKFVCPSCGHVASVKDWKDAGAPEGAVAFSCVGRYIGDDVDDKIARDKAFRNSGGPCNYAGGGLFRLNPVAVDFEEGKEPMQVFAFADVPDDKE